MTVQTKSRWRQTDAFDTKPVMRAAGQSSAPPQKEPAKKAPAKSPTNPAAKPDALNLDSLFAGMSNEKKSRSSSQDNLLDDLDIDSLFDKVESSSSLPSIDSSKQEEKTAVMERPNLSDPNKK